MRKQNKFRFCGVVCQEPKPDVAQYLFSLHEKQAGIDILRNLQTKEMISGEKYKAQRIADDLLLDEVNYQAQRAILSAGLLDSRKDAIVDATIVAIHQIRERRVSYYDIQGKRIKSN